MFTPIRRTILIICLTLLLFTIALEIFKSVFPLPWKVRPFTLHSRYIFDADVGRWHQPNSVASHYGACYAVDEVRFNSFGMRDKERSKKKDKFRIAIFGDSMIEGAHVKDEQTVNRVIEDLLKGKVECLNFGVSGFGTGQEYVLYEKKAKEFNPDLVIVGFFAKNDVRDNSLVLRSRMLKEANQRTPDNVPFFGLDSHGNLTLIHKPELNPAKSAPPQPPSPKITFFQQVINALKFRFPRVFGLVNNLEIFSAINFYCNSYYDKMLIRTARNLKWSLNLGETRNVDEIIGWHPSVYATDPPRAWQEAWEITEKILLHWNNDCKKNGAKLVVVTLPYDFELQLDIKKEYFLYTGFYPLQNLDMSYPHRRIEDFCQKNNIIGKSFLPEFFKYRDDHKLSNPPFMGYKCDGHYAPHGHRYLAECIVKFLIDNQLIPLN
ncbi:hypothetical protein A2V61_00350 [Candidatus Woesebacteria bacterium RBG_19FT_COMBO_47_8]|nr:MAG: hypothetical protein A2V61_00350 [Candidatus Woesebacteria bacterium RBG_19FT_COMBO_47_8]